MDPAPIGPELAKVLALAPRMQFFALVSLLERMTPDAERVGGPGPPSAEMLRFRADPSMGFPAGDVSQAGAREVAQRPGDRSGGTRVVLELMTTFLGLTGSVSPLPLHIPAEVAQDPAARGVQQDFLDIFHHRLISLFYRLWTRYQIAREHVVDGTDVWSSRIIALSGYDSYAQDAWLPLPPSLLLRLSPLLCGRVRTARTLELALGALLEEDLAEGERPRIEQFAGTIAQIDSGQQMKLGSATAVLGRTAVIGGTARDPGSGFAIHAKLRGEITLTDYMAGGAKLEQVRSLVYGLLHEPLDFDLHVEVASSAQRGFALSTERPAPLGRTTWLRGRGSSRRMSVRNLGQAA